MSDAYGCPAGIDFTTDDNVVFVTRCKRSANHKGKHNDKRTKRWTDEQTTWTLTPPSVHNEAAERLRILVADLRTFRNAHESENWRGWNVPQQIDRILAAAEADA